MAISKKELMARLHKRYMALGFRKMWVHPSLQDKVRAVFNKALGKN